MKSDCEAGHLTHDTLDLGIYLSGRHPDLHDVPKIAEKFERQFKLRIFDWKKYANTPGYCPGDDSISLSIATHGIWEAFETCLILDILSRGDRFNTVVDIGANIGWYTLLALLDGYPVKAYECDLDIRKLLVHNIRLNLPANIEVKLVAEKIKETTKVEIVSKKIIEFLKCDIEGSEQYAFRIYRNHFRTGKVKYAMFEISPCFNDSYPGIIEELVSYGYRVYEIPKKGTMYLEEFEQEPLETLKKHFEVKTSDWNAYLKDIHQDDFIFIREDLV